MNHKTVVLSAAVACLFTGALRTEAATITSFTAAYSYASGSGFTSTGPVVSYTANTATVTSTSITCLGLASASQSLRTAAAISATSGCSGRVLDFSIGVTGLTAASPFTAAIDGTVNGSAPDTGQLTTSLGTNNTFTFGPGAFNTTIVSSTLPPIGSGLITGFLSLSLATGQTVSLPSSLAFTLGSPSSVPEPGSVALLASGLGMVAFFIRRRATRS